MEGVFRGHGRPHARRTGHRAQKVRLYVPCTARQVQVRQDGVRAGRCVHFAVARLCITRVRLRGYPRLLPLGNYV